MEMSSFDPPELQFLPRSGEETWLSIDFLEELKGRCAE